MHDRSDVGSLRPCRRRLSLIAYSLLVHCGRRSRQHVRGTSRSSQPYPHCQSHHYASCRNPHCCLLCAFCPHRNAALCPKPEPHKTNELSGKSERIVCLSRHGCVRFDSNAASISPFRAELQGKEDLETDG